MFIYESPIGKLILEEKNNKLIRLDFYDGEKIIENKNSFIREVVKQLDEYFNKKRKKFDIPIELNGTEFQKKVWLELQKIPYGETRSYKEIANNIGCLNGQRAIGNANNKNKIIIIVPCHRVIGTNGTLVGFACGLDAKKYLLDIEKDML